MNCRNVIETTNSASFIYHIEAIFSFVALGLYRGSDDLQDHEATEAAIAAAQRFMARFEEEVGAVTCRKIQEDVVFGPYMDPAASPENMKAFQETRGFEKCSLIAGIGARLAAEIIIESMAQQH